MGYTFTWNFLGLGFTVILKILVMGAEGKYNWIILRASRGLFQVNRYQVFFVFKKRAQIRTSFQWLLGTKIVVPSPRSLILLTSNCFCYFFKILGLGINICQKFRDWVVAEILAAHTPVWIYSEVPPPPREKNSSQVYLLLINFPRKAFC